LQVFHKGLLVGSVSNTTGIKITVNKE